jgi:hypothetical protein
MQWAALLKPDPSSEPERGTAASLVSEAAV